MSFIHYHADILRIQTIKFFSRLQRSTTVAPHRRNENGAADDKGEGLPPNYLHPRRPRARRLAPVGDPASGAFLPHLVVLLLRISSHKACGFVDRDDIPVDQSSFLAGANNLASKEFIGVNLQNVQRYDEYASLKTNSQHTNDGGGANDHQSLTGGGDGVTMLEDQASSLGVSSLEDAQVDVRSGRVASLILSTPLLPPPADGGKNGNGLLWTVDTQHGVQQEEGDLLEGWYDKIKVDDVYYFSGDVNLDYIHMLEDAAPHRDDAHQDSSGDPKNGDSDESRDTIGGPPESTSQWERYAKDAIRGWIFDHEKHLEIDARELFATEGKGDGVHMLDESAPFAADGVSDDVRLAVHNRGELVQIYLPRTYRGVPVIGSHATASIRNGNLVYFTLDHWSDVVEVEGGGGSDGGEPLDVKPALSVDDAWDILSEYIGDSFPGIVDYKSIRDVELWCKPELHVLVTSPEKEIGRKEGGVSGGGSKTDSGSNGDESAATSVANGSSEIEMESNDFYMNFNNRNRRRLNVRNLRGLTTNKKDDVNNNSTNNDNNNNSNKRRTTGTKGYYHRLIYRLCPRLSPSLRYESHIDAHSGKMYSFRNRIDFLEVRGSVYPKSNDGAPPDGTLQRHWPMPFVDVTVTSGGGDRSKSKDDKKKTKSKVFTANFSGRLDDFVSGKEEVVVSARLEGPYVWANDTCGESKLVGSGWSGILDWGGEEGGNDCGTPSSTIGKGGAGNTHSSRSAYYELNMIKSMARSHLPDNTWLNAKLVANTNLDEGVCNAYWDGTSVNFFRGVPGRCRNTGEIAAVVAHEWGHGLDENDLVQFISEPSGEGIADIYAALRFKDSCIGRGYYTRGRKCNIGEGHCLECTGVRDIDYRKVSTNNPHTLTWANANCDGSVHCLGLVYAEAIWSLLAKLAEFYGFDENTSLEIVTRLSYVAAGHVSTWYSGMAPFGGCSPGSGYLNFIIADDNDGDLSNGTPHMRAIFEVFNDLEIACDSPAVVDSGCEGIRAVEAPVVIAEPGRQEMTLAWDRIPGATSYEVFRTEGPGGCDMGKIKLAETKDTFYDDVDLLDGREYFYIVIAKEGGSCFGPSSQCIAVTPLAPPGVHLTCPSGTIVLNLLDESPRAEVECLVEAFSEYEGTVELDCTPKIDNAICIFPQTTFSFTKDHTSEIVAFHFDAADNVEKTGEVALAWSYAGTKRVKSLPIWLVEYGEPQSAEFDPSYAAPACANPGRYCSSESLLEGRGTRLGPELNAPNTLMGSPCSDGNLGTHRVDESIEKIAVRSGGADEPAGNFMREGEVATIEATVHAYGTGNADRADFYYASDPSNPDWVWITTMTPGQGGLVNLKASYILPKSATPNQVVRVHYRYRGTPSFCSDDSYAEADDLVFSVLPQREGKLHPKFTLTTTATSSPVQSPTHQPSSQPSALPTQQPVRSTNTNMQYASYDSELGVPICRWEGPICDTGNLLDGRGKIGFNGTHELNFPNTLDTCKDGNKGSYHRHGSIDKLIVRMIDRHELKKGFRIMVEATVYSQKKHNYTADFYYAADANDPSWMWIDSLAPSREGEQQIEVPYDLPDDGSSLLRAVRVNFRSGASRSPCSEGNRDDADDLVFTVARREAPLPLPTKAPSGISSPKLTESPALN